jgi:hypothetical protein
VLDELKSNARLRIGLVIAFGLVVVTQLLDAQAALRAKRMQATRLQTQLSQLSVSAQDSAWLERAKAAHALRERLDAGLWRASDVGVAEASFVDWMNRQLGEAKAGGPSVLSAIPAGARVDLPTMPAGTRLLRLNVRFDFVPGAAEKMLDRLASSGRFLVVEGLSVRRQPVPKVELTVSSVAHLTNAAGERKP